MSKQRYGDRNEKLRITDGQAKDLSQQLVEVREQQERLICRERELKDAILKHLPLNGWVLAKGEKGQEFLIEKNRCPPKNLLQSKKALIFVRKRFGEEAALELLENCGSQARKNATVYVRRRDVKPGSG